MQCAVNAIGRYCFVSFICRQYLYVFAASSIMHNKSEYHHYFDIKSCKNSFILSFSYSYCTSCSCIPRRRRNKITHKNVCRREQTSFRATKLFNETRTMRRKKKRGLWKITFFYIFLFLQKKKTNRRRRKYPLPTRKI